MTCGIVSTLKTDYDIFSVLSSELGLSPVNQDNRVANCVGGGVKDGRRSEDLSELLPPRGYDISVRYQRLLPRTRLPSTCDSRLSAS